MGARENDVVQDDWSEPPSPIEVLQQLSKEAVRMAGEAWHHAYPANTPTLQSVPRHRRSRSEIVTSYHNPSGSTSNFQRLKGHMQRALHMNGRCSRDDSQYSSFDPEILANQKRQWYQLNSKALGTDVFQEPSSLFEHFVVVGLQPDAKLEFVEDAYIRGKKFEQQMKKIETSEFNMRPLRPPKFPMMEPQVLFMYPPRKKLDLQLQDLAAFCFPSGVKARVLERSPSLSELNGLVYGQVAGNATLYGVCLRVQEVVQRPPAIYGSRSPLPQPNSVGSRWLIAAPRCYCILTKVPLFGLHYQILNSMVAQDRLNRITSFVEEMAVASSEPPPSMQKQHSNVKPPGSASDTNWMASAIPVKHAATLAAAAAGIISDTEASSRCQNSPRSATASDASENCQIKDLDKDSSKNIDSPSSKNIDSPSSKNIDSPSANLGNQSVTSIRSLESLFSPARSMASDDGSTSQDEDPTDDVIMEWSRENKNDLLQIVCGYHRLNLPERGSKVNFQPLEHMQPIEFRRFSAADLGYSDKYIEKITKVSKEDSEVKLKLANAEEASSISLWSISTICRVLSLDSDTVTDPQIMLEDDILTLITGVLLEKQIIMMCPNLGILSAVVLSVIPMIRPFEWQSLFLPILPARMVDFLDAPVPFIVGTQHKLTDLKRRSPNLVHINLMNDHVTSCSLPKLPRHQWLVSELRPIHSKLSCEDADAPRHPVYKCDAVQSRFAIKFVTVLRKYLESICSDLRLHTITNVQSNQKVAILIKDSYIDSFPIKDQPFIKLFVETQQFSVLSDYRLMCIENE
ncbi:hypothetical protein SASPL_111203 [Salvia splendens]|uniref:UDENN domain-containing protein n=1 Tax=Salvia splendens TaxID=180675 RepID=A0A8X8Y8K5_SALSN|nr:hypothetical protein SASPL_111203 [Salvia splendens]